MCQTEPTAPARGKSQGGAAGFSRRGLPFRLRYSVYSPQSSRAFSLLEMLIVTGVIALLISMVLVVGQAVISDTKVKDTRLMMAQLDNAIRVFAEDYPYKPIKQAIERYGLYPPDDLMAFTPKPADIPPGAGHGQNGVYDQMPNLMPGGRATYVKDDVLTTDLTDDFGDDSYVANGDIKALVWSLRSQPSSSAIYDAIPDRFRVPVDTRDEFFDMNGNDSFDLLIDKEVQYLVDAWGNPLSYYATRYLAEVVVLGGDPTTHGWVSQKLLESNKGLPVLASYGLDGDLQIERGQTLEEQYLDPTILPGDLVFGDPRYRPMNDDNLYLDDALNDKMVEIIKE